MSLLGIHLELIWLSCDNQRFDEHSCVTKMHVFIFQSMKEQQPIRRVGKIGGMRHHTTGFVSSWIVLRSVHVSFCVAGVVGFPCGDGRSSNGDFEQIWKLTLSHKRKITSVTPASDRNTIRVYYVLLNQVLQNRRLDPSLPRSPSCCEALLQTPILDRQIPDCQ